MGSKKSSKKKVAKKKSSKPLDRAKARRRIARGRYK